MPGTSIVSSFRSHLRALLGRYRRLPERHRVQVASACLAAGALLAWLVLLKPALDFGSHARADFDRENQLLHWMQEYAEQARQLAASPRRPAGADDSLLALVSSTAKERNLALQRIEPGADGKLTLWLSDVEFDALLTWLEILVREHRVQIDRINLSKSTGPGAVEAQIILRR